jgi:hypothetical protein
MVNHYTGVKTKQQMADEYGICRKTFIKMLKKRNIQLERVLISPKEQILIYNELGDPTVTYRISPKSKSSQ